MDITDEDNIAQAGLFKKCFGKKDDLFDTDDDSESKEFSQVSLNSDSKTFTSNSKGSDGKTVIINDGGKHSLVCNIKRSASSNDATKIENAHQRSSSPVIRVNSFSQYKEYDCFHISIAENLRIVGSNTDTRELVVMGFHGVLIYDDDNFYVIYSKKKIITAEHINLSKESISEDKVIDRFAEYFPIYVKSVGVSYKATNFFYTFLFIMASI
jgi:hypothetical protein